MAVEYVKSKDNTLGMLGTLANVGGMVTGTPWLTSLGLGLGAMNSMVNGELPTEKQEGGLSEILTALKDKINTWKNPAKDNIAKAAKTISDAAKKVASQPTDEELAAMWGRYAGTAGYNGWPTYNTGW